MVMTPGAPRSDRSFEPGRAAPKLPASERFLRFLVFLLIAGAAAPKAAFSDDAPVDSGTTPEPRTAEAPRLASRTKPSPAGTSLARKAAGDSGTASGSPHGAPVRLDIDPIAAAKQAILDCRARFAGVHDYTCTFHKHERVEGKLVNPHIMQMKARTKPNSFYMKFDRPNKGREAIYVAGRNKGSLIAHDVGIVKVLAGTMRLDPKSELAMDGCRHPITEAGIGALIESVARHWARELTPAGSVVTIHPGMTIGPHAVTMIESTHPKRRADYLFYKVKLYIDHEHGLPIRIEAYDWPKRPGGSPDLLESYTYTDLKLNVGLTDHDFDVNNKAYAFGRF